MSEPPWLEIPDSAYCFGVGTLRIAATGRVVARTWRASTEWWTVDAVEYCWNGQVIGPRRVDVKATVLRESGFLPAA